MTATHLKRLFASQDSYGSSDRIVSGQTVTEGDEEEAESHTDEKARVANVSEECRGSAAEPISAPVDISSDIPQLVLDTPMPRANPLEYAAQAPPDDASAPIRTQQAEDNCDERIYDSDSTISALPFINKHRGHATNQRVCGDSSASGMDPEVRVLPSRLPRRTKPTPTYVYLGLPKDKGEADPQSTV